MGAVGQGGQTHYNMGANQTVTQLMRELETQVNTARTAAASATATPDGNSTLRRTRITGIVNDMKLYSFQVYADIPAPVNSSIKGTAFSVGTSGGNKTFLLTSAHVVRDLTTGTAASPGTLRVVDNQGGTVLFTVVAYDDGADVAVGYIAGVWPHLAPWFVPANAAVNKWRALSIQGEESMVYGFPWVDKGMVTFGHVADAGTTSDIAHGATYGQRTHVVVDNPTWSGNSGSVVLSVDRRTVIGMQSWGASREVAGVNQPEPNTHVEPIDVFSACVPQWVLRNLYYRVVGTASMTGNLQTARWQPEITFTEPVVTIGSIHRGVRVSTRASSSTFNQPGVNESIGELLIRTAIDPVANTVILVRCVVTVVPAGAQYANLLNTTLVFGYRDGELSPWDLAYLEQDGNAPQTYTLNVVLSVNGVEVTHPLTILV